MPKPPKIKIDPNIIIQDLLEKHPELAEILIVDYGFHCVGCFLAGYETLEEGAKTHGITGEEFKNLLKNLGKKLNTKD